MILMKNIIRQMGAIIVLLLSLVSCDKEQRTSPSENKNHQVDVRFQLKVSTPGSPTYAAVEYDEFTVNDVYVFFFNTKTGRVHDMVQGTDITSSGNETKSFKATLIMDATSQSQFEMYVLANIASFMEGKTQSDFVGKSYNDLQMMLQKAINGKFSVLENGLVMWGKADGLLPTSASQDITVPMIRAFARVDVGLGVRGNWNGKDANNQPIPFKLTEVHIYKPNNAYSFMPLAASYDQANRKVTAHSAVGAAQSNALKYDVSGGLSIAKEIYISESDVLMGTPETAAPGDSFHTSRCAIVVGGQYNSSTSTTYYRIDFKDNRNPKKLIDVLRNHRYLVNIVSVAAPGLPTAQEAYQSIILNANIDVEITQWNDLSQDIIFDGDHWVYIQKKNLTLPGSAGAWGGLIIGSDVDVKDWKMSFDATNFNTTKSIENDYFKVTKPDLSEGGSLKIETLQTITDGQTKTAVLTLKIGRLTFDISLKQTPDTPLDWENGKDYETNL